MNNTQHQNINAINVTKYLNVSLPTNRIYKLIIHQKSKIINAINADVSSHMILPYIITCEMIISKITPTTATPTATITITRRRRKRMSQKNQNHVLYVAKCLSHIILRNSILDCIPTNCHSNVIDVSDDLKPSTNVKSTKQNVKIILINVSIA